MDINSNPHDSAHSYYQEFQKKFRTDELSLFNTTYWGVSVRPRQVTFGSLLIYALRPCDSFRATTMEEGCELGEAISLAENLLYERLPCDRINYLSLMMVDPHLHIHVIPRYQEPVRMADGMMYEDLAWPGPPDLSKVLPVSEIELAVLAHLQESGPTLSFQRDD